MEIEMGFTQEQLAMYEAYEEVRAGGQYNMFDPRARRAAGLTEDEYLFVMENFSELRAVHTKTMR